MKMIASTKLTRAQKQMHTAKSFGKASNATLKMLEPKVPEDSKKKLLIACSSDRGLCGAIHSTVSKPVKRAVAADPANSLVVVIGDKPKTQIQRTARENIVLSVGSIGKQTPTYAEVAAITDLIFGLKLEFGEAQLFYNEFKSVIAYELGVMKVYPDTVLSASEKLTQYEIEDDVLKNYAEFTFANALYSALAEGHASEIAARRTAMENATKNAGEVIEDLTMKFNRGRQAAITNELVEVITGKLVYVFCCLYSRCICSVNLLLKQRTINKNSHSEIYFVDK
jgi:F-type H+-transporting ATPase subunit gamma